MNKPRRIFLKVLATGPLAGCAGADPASSPGFGGSEGKSGEGVGGMGVGGNPLASGGSSLASGGSSAGSGSPVVVGGATGNNPFGSSGTSSGGFSFATGGKAGGASTGGVGSGSAGAGSAGVGSVGAGGNTSNLTAAGNVSAVPVGSLVVAAGIFLLGRDAKGLYAMSMQCTHKGCAVVFSGSELDCPCHHSRFDTNGNVLVGPATAPLPHFAVFVDAAGNISVDRYTVVSGSLRTPV